MSPAGDDYEQALQLLPKTISANIHEAARKTESISTGYICRVPEDIRKLNESAYTPRLIAIGPLHHNDKHLQTQMQDLKKSYANHLLNRLIEGEKSTLLQECTAEMKMLLDKARKSYAEEDVALDEEMLLVDGCFVVELLYRFYELKSIHKEEEEEGGGGFNVASASASPSFSPHLQNRMTRMQRPLGGERELKISSETRISDPIFDSKQTAAIIKNDLLLLENQIPFFVLEKLFQLTVDRIPSNRPHKFSLTEYVSLYFGTIMSPEDNSTNCGLPSDIVLRIIGNTMKSPEQDQGLTSQAGYYHMLHKLHEDYRPHNPDDHEMETKELSELMPSATELDYAGVKFVPGMGKDLFKVKFNEPKGQFWWCNRACFEIPILGINESTESFLRNLIAFEQSCPGVSQHFTSYAFLMDMLVNSEKDVKLLEKAGILRNNLGGSKNAANLFDNLCKEVILGEFFFAEVCNTATEYSERFWQNNLRGLKRTYFDHPWAFIALCLGIIPFGMTVASLVRKFL